MSDGEISMYQFMVSFMGVYFSGQAAGQVFGFASSKYHSPKPLAYEFEVH